MSKASDLIERLERETGQRIDNNDGNNFAMAGLIGALFRSMNKTSYEARDDVAVGIMIRHKHSPEYRMKREVDDMLADLMIAGMSPDDIKKVTR